MPQLRKDMQDETANTIAGELHSETKEIFSKVVETDWRFTQHNFLVNAGGAVAVLAYLGTSSSSKFAIWPLLCFLVGVVASGIEIRMLLASYRILYIDALNRLNGFMKSELPAEQTAPSASVARVQGTINKISGWIAQVSFLLGVAVGLFLYFCNAP